MTMRKQELRAYAASLGGWGVVASDKVNRYSTPRPDRRNGRWCWRCAQGDAKAEATHRCFANGVCMARDVCEFHAYQWVKGTARNGGTS